MKAPSPSHKARPRRPPMVRRYRAGINALRAAAGLPAHSAKDSEVRLGRDVLPPGDRD